MSVTGFIGQAGTGKTTRLMDAVEVWVNDHELKEGQTILALTRMHGSRIRLRERLQRTTARNRFECATFDKFAWSIASRWRSLLRENGRPLAIDLDYDATCGLAAMLLKNAEVLNWVRRKYALIIVDEFQDCHDERLEMTIALANGGDMIFAADEFQDLSDDTEANEAVAWLLSHGQVQELSSSYRTTRAGILQAAACLRTRQGTLQKGDGFNIIPAYSHNMAAKYIANGALWAGRKQFAILSPVGPSSSPNVKRTLERVAEKPFTKEGKEPVGPFSIEWEASNDEKLAALCDLFGFPNEDGVEIHSPVPNSNGPPIFGQRDLEAWIRRQARLLGKTTFLSQELRAAATKAVHHLRVAQRDNWHRRGMTIHQAKNREFDNVLILWPFGVTKGQGEEKRRRLLYNAVTRAKYLATVVVFDKNGSRIANDEFLRH